METATTEAPKTLALSVSLIVPDDMRQQLSAGEKALEVVKSYTIEDNDTARAIAEEMNGYKRAIEFLKGWREKFLAPAKQQVETANEFFNPGIKGYEGAEAQCKRLLADWDAREKKRVALENLQREELARKLRQEAEAKAAGALARAREEAAEKERKAREAEEKGNAARAAQLREQARAAEESGAARAREAHLEAAAKTEAAPLVEQTKIVGAQMRDKWVFEFAPGVTDFGVAKKMIVDAIAKGREDLLGYLDLNEIALRKAAEGLHEGMAVPGFVAVNRPIVAGSKK
jgi:hypothetical protein